MGAPAEELSLTEWKLTLLLMLLLQPGHQSPSLEVFPPWDWGRLWVSPHPCPSHSVRPLGKVCLCSPGPTSPSLSIFTRGRVFRSRSLVRSGLSDQLGPMSRASYSLCPGLTWLLTGHPPSWAPCPGGHLAASGVWHSFPMLGLSREWSLLRTGGAGLKDRGLEVLVGVRECAFQYPHAMVARLINRPSPSHH